MERNYAEAKAYYMLKDNYTISCIAAKTGLTKEDVRKIKRKYKVTHPRERILCQYNKQSLIVKKKNAMKKLIEEVNRVNGTNYVWREV